MFIHLHKLIYKTNDDIRLVYSTMGFKAWKNLEQKCEKQKNDKILNFLIIRSVKWRAPHI